MRKEEKIKSCLKKLIPLKHLWPAVLIICLIAVVLPLTQPVLAALPQRLEMPEQQTENSSSELEEQEEQAAETTKKSEAAEPEEAVELAAVMNADYVDGVYTGSAQGYGGTITAQVTVENGLITAVDILSADGETTSFFNRAMGVVESVLTQQTWEVDAISGATYSSKGILAAIQAALTGQQVQTEAPVQTSPAASLTTDAYEAPQNGYQDGTYYGSATGFGGTIQVEVVIADGKISSIQVVSAPGETASYFSSATAVIDRVLSANSPNVDTVSGATYSSNGILNAVKRALSQAAGGETEETDTPADSEETPEPGETNIPDEPEETPEPEEPTEPTEPEILYRDGIYTGTAEGFGGDITVQVTIENGRIRSVEILSAEDETPAYLSRAEVLLTTIQAAQSAEVDVVSGATWSSKGILEATKIALAQAVLEDQEEPENPDLPEEVPAETVPVEPEEALIDKEDGA